MHSSSSAQTYSPRGNSSLGPYTFDAEFSISNRRDQEFSASTPRSYMFRSDAFKDNLTDASLAFEPTVQTTIKVGTAIGFNYGANIYDENYNMVISCPSNGYIHFLDADNLAPHGMRQKRKIDSSVVQISYDAETGTYIMGCATGEIYSYNASADTLTRVLKQGNNFILAIADINSNTFAFSSSMTKQLYFRKADTREVVAHYSKNSVTWYLLHLKEQGRLLAGLANGQIAIYNTTKGDKHPMVSSIQAHKHNKQVVSVISASIKGHDYVISASNDKTIKILKFVKGNLRVLKVINNTEETSTMVYLEKYQMIVTTHHSNFVKFFKVPTGELQATLYLKESKKTRNIFLMKDKNAIGVADLRKNIIEFVQLHPLEKEAESLSYEEISFD